MRIVRTAIATVAAAAAVVISVSVAGSAHAATGLPSPTLTAPTLSAPTLSVPTVQAPPMPTLQAPSLPSGGSSTTTVQAPSLQAPQLQVPTLQAPQLQTPGGAGGSASLTVPTLTVPQLQVPVLPVLQLPTITIPTVPGQVASGAAQALGMPTVFVLPTASTPGGVAAAGDSASTVKMTVLLGRTVAKASKLSVSVGGAYSITASGVKAGKVKVLVKVGAAWVEIGSVKAGKKSVTLPTFSAPAAGEYVIKVSGKNRSGYLVAVAS